MAIPTTAHPHIDKEIMQEYLESLKELLSHHLDTHKNLSKSNHRRNSHIRPTNNIVYSSKSRSENKH